MRTRKPKETELVILNQKRKILADELMAAIVRSEELRAQLINEYLELACKIGAINNQKRPRAV
jgi:hypothetical protein